MNYGYANPLPFADMLITYRDGSTETLSSIRIAVHRDEVDPVKYENSILAVEDQGGNTHYRVEVRGWTFIHPEPWNDFRHSDEPPF